jgi:hypothetical protein
MLDFKFFGDNIDKRPKTIEEVRISVIENLNILYNGSNYTEEYLNEIVKIVCNHLNIEHYD